MSRRALLCAAGLALAAAACGGASPKAGANPDASLQLQVTLAPGTARQASLVCEGGAAKGTGYLQADADARAACTAALSDANRPLVDTALADRICTEIYGGPQRAVVTGEIRGRTVRTTITRSNGCGIADWDALEALLGPPD